MKKKQYSYDDIMYLINMTDMVDRLQELIDNAPQPNEDVSTPEWQAIGDSLNKIETALLTAEEHADQLKAVE